MKTKGRGKKVKGAPRLAKPAEVNQLMQGIEEAVRTKKGGPPQITRIRDASGPGGALK